MQSDVPPLPISCLTNKRFSRDNNSVKSSLGAEENKNKSWLKSSRSGFSIKNKLCSRIAEESPYRNSRPTIPLNTAKSSNKSVICQRISSAKMLRIKQLQNQLADAHGHLNELANENKLLKTIQKRQDAALKRYEGTNAELPRIIHGHHEDLRVLQTKFKKLKCQYKETNDTLKEKENELHSLQVQNKKLLQLSKDRHLGEREKLQIEVFDLNHRINQQDEIIQTLKRKLAVDSKYLKHQLHTEMVKHKETQKQLQETQFKLKSLEAQVDQRLNRSHQINRIGFFNKDRSTATSQSLTNLNRSEILIKGETFRKRRSSAAVTGQSLPALHRLSISAGNQPQEPQKLNKESSSGMTETRINFEQIRHFRLHQSPSFSKSGPYSASRSSIRDSPIKESELEEIGFRKYPVELDINSGNGEVFELPKTLKHQYFRPIQNDKNLYETLNTYETNELLNTSDGPKLVHPRLANSTVDNTNANKNEIKNKSSSPAEDNATNVIENGETKHDYDSNLVSKDLLKRHTDSTTQNSNNNADNKIALPIESNTDEDENILPIKNFVAKNLEMEKRTNASSHLSQLFSQFSQTSNHSLDFNEANEQITFNLKGDETHAKPVESSLTDSANCKIDEKPADNLKQKDLSLKIVPVEGNVRDYSEANKKNLTSNQIKSRNEKTSSMMKETSIIDDNKRNSKETKCNSKNSYPNGKPYNNNNNINNKLKDSDFKSKTEQKTVGNSKTFDKNKLLAAMKAIDDNDNIEFIDKRMQNNALINKVQIRENLYRGIPNLKKKSDIIKELFMDT